MKVHPNDMPYLKDKYDKAILLRKSGASIKNIAQQLHISSSTASIWCRDIRLTSVQQKVLATKGKSSMILQSYARRRHLEKISSEKLLFERSVNEVERLDQNEFFIAGIALYWAEGFKSKTEKTLGFCNSDPFMVNFMIQWFKEFFNLADPDFILRAEFNIDHLDRREVIESYWSEITGIPRSQFNKPYLQKTKQIRVYRDRNSYRGLLRIRIRKSTKHLVRMRGWLEGLVLAVPQQIGLVK